MSVLRGVTVEAPYSARMPSRPLSPGRRISRTDFTGGFRETFLRNTRRVTPRLGRFDRRLEPTRVSAPTAKAIASHRTKPTSSLQPSRARCADGGPQRDHRERQRCQQRHDRCRRGVRLRAQRDHLDAAGLLEGIESPKSAVPVRDRRLGRGRPRAVDRSESAHRVRSAPSRARHAAVQCRAVGIRSPRDLAMRVAWGLRASPSYRHPSANHAGPWNSLPCTLRHRRAGRPAR